MKVENNPFEEGDRIKVRGHEYIVERVDTTPIDNRIIQWCLEGCHDGEPAGTLDIVDGQFVFKEYREVNENDIEVIND